MAQVPYSPVPSQAVSGAGISEVHTNVASGAFGGDVAQAISGVGKAVEGAGDHIYERAIWLQNQQNQADARQAAADYTIAAGGLAAKYNALEGENAVKAYDKYTQDLKDLRAQHANTLDAPMARRMFDNESLGTLSHAIFNGASHSAGQQKAYIIGSMKADTQSLYEQTGQNPQDEILYEKNLKKVANTARQEALLHGQPDAAENNAHGAQSGLAVTRIQAISQDNALEGRRVFEENRKYLTKDALLQMDDYTQKLVVSEYASKGGKDLVASHLDEDGLTLTVPAKELIAKSNDLAEKLLPGDNKLKTAMSQSVMSEINRVKYYRKEEIRDAESVINDLMISGVPDVASAMKDPKGAVAIDTLKGTAALTQLDGRFYRYNQAINKSYNDAVMKEMDGMRDNAREEFLSIDPTKLPDVSRSNIDTIHRWQKEARKAVDKVVPSSHYKTILKDQYTEQMNTLNLLERSKNKVEYDRFTGSISSAIDGWKEATGSKTYPTDAQFLKDIAPTLMKQTIKDGFWKDTWFESKTYGYQAADKSSDTYKAYVKEKTEEYRKRNMAPDLFEIDRRYARQVFKEIIETQKGPAK